MNTHDAPFVRPVLAALCAASLATLAACGGSACFGFDGCSGGNGTPNVAVSGTAAIGKALASDYVLPELRASGVGWYNTIVGLCGLVASLVGGWLWDHVGHTSVFLFGAAFAAVGSVALLILVPADVTALRSFDPAS